MKILLILFFATFTISAESIDFQRLEYRQSYQTSCHECPGPVIYSYPADIEQLRKYLSKKTSMTVNDEQYDVDHYDITNHIAFALRNFVLYNINNTLSKPNKLRIDVESKGNNSINFSIDTNGIVSDIKIIGPLLKPYRAAIIKNITNIGFGKLANYNLEVSIPINKVKTVIDKRENIEKSFQKKSDIYHKKHYLFQYRDEKIKHICSGCRGFATNATLFGLGGMSTLQKP